MVEKRTRLVQQAFLDEKVNNVVSATKRIITERKAQHGLECENSKTIKGEENRRMKQKLKEIELRK